VTSHSGGRLVLVVEDEPAIADLIRMHLERAGYRVRCVGAGDTALASIGADNPDAVILDVGLPGMDGIEVCRRMRASGNWVPVIFVTARDDEVDRVVGLEIGGDDYVTKPFSPRELVARVGVVLRRAQGPVPASELLAVGGVSLDLRTRRVHAAGRDVELTVTEFDLLACLMRRPGWVFSRDQLMSEVWGYSAVPGTRTVDVHIAQLRSKLGDAAIVRTVRGVGYSAEAGALSRSPAEPESAG
jgi:two-component system, OmpR family, response regulator MtrA